MAELVDKEARALEARSLLNNRLLTEALRAIEYGATENLIRGENEAHARAVIGVVREFKMLLEMAITDAKQAATRPRVA